MGKEVIILAGGLGTRLRSVIDDVPKCMAPVAGRPFLWYLLRYLSHFDVEKVILSVGYLRHVVIEWIDERGDEFPFGIDFSIETTPLGTGGGIRLALNKCLTDDIIVLNGDTFFDVDLNELYLQHSLYPASITLALKPMREFSRYGNVVLNNNLITNFEEKRYCEEGLINGGVYVVSKNEGLFDGLPERFSFETEVLQPQCRLENLYGVVQDGYFIDIGIPEDYERANREFTNISLFNDETYRY